MSKRLDGGVGDHVMEKTHEIGDNIHDIASIVKNAVEEKFRDLFNGAVKTGERGKEKAVEVRDDVASYVGARPITSVLVAASLGFVIGKLLDRR